MYEKYKSTIEDMMPFMNKRLQKDLHTFWQSLDNWAERPLRIAFGGAFNAGKSMLINCLLGEGLLPSRETPATATPIQLRYGENLVITAHLSNQSTLTWTQKELHELAILNHQRACQMQNLVRVEIEHPAPFLKHCIEIIDLPGIADTKHSDDIVTKVLKNVDLLVYVITGDKPFDLTELNYIQQNILKNGFNHILFVCNRLNLLQTGVKETEQHIQKQIQRLKVKLPPNVSTYYRVDALLVFNALIERVEDAEDVAALPNFQIFKQSIEGLMAQKKIFLHSKKSVLRTYVAQIYAQLMAQQLQLQEKIRIFEEERKRAEAHQKELIREAKYRVRSQLGQLEQALIDVNFYQDIYDYHFEANDSIDWIDQFKAWYKQKVNYCLEDILNTFYDLELNYPNPVVECSIALPVPCHFPTLEDMSGWEQLKNWWYNGIPQAEKERKLRETIHEICDEATVTYQGYVRSRMLTSFYHVQKVILNKMYFVPKPIPKEIQECRAIVVSLSNLLRKLEAIRVELVIEPITLYPLPFTNFRWILKIKYPRFIWNAPVELPIQQDTHYKHASKCRWFHFFKNNYDFLNHKYGQPPFYHPSWMERCLYNIIYKQYFFKR